MPPNDSVRIRGTSDGLVISFGAGQWADILAELEERLEQTPEFFRGGRVAASVGRRVLGEEDIRALGEQLERYGITLWAVWSEAMETQDAARVLGLEGGLPTDKPQAVHARSEGQGIPERALIVQGPLRSGQRIQHQGSVVVIGDVHPGAEVVCGGHVIVWGRLEGTVYAGILGQEDVLVCALAFAPAHVRIGRHMAQGDDAPAPGVPEMARVVDGAIVVEPWTGLDKDIHESPHLT